MNGQQIRKMRKRKFLTQQDLAAMIGVWPSAVRDWESNLKHPNAVNTGKLIELSQMTNNEINEKLGSMHVHDNTTNE